MSEVDNNNNNLIEKMSESRMKDKNKLIKRQVEFYFSNANLSRDKFLRDKIFNNNNYYVPVDMIMNFKKIQNLTTDKDEFLKICKESEFVELNEDETMIRKSGPFKRKTIQESSICQIYLENIPTETTVEELEEELKDLGKIVYVNLRNPNIYPGTAFIEFDDVQEAIRASTMDSEFRSKYNIQYFPKWLFNHRKTNGTLSYASIIKQS